MALHLVPPSGEAQDSRPHLHQVLLWDVLLHDPARRGFFSIDVSCVNACVCSGVDTKAKPPPLSLLDGQALLVWDVELEDWLPGRVGFDAHLGQCFVGFFWQPSTHVNVRPMPRFAVPLEELARRGTRVHMSVKP